MTTIPTPRAVCAVHGCENAPAWQKVVKLRNGGLAFYYYCEDHRPTATTTDQAATVSITAIGARDAAVRLAEIAQLYHAGNETLGGLSMYERAAITAGVTPGEADAIIERARGEVRP